MLPTLPYPSLMKPRLMKSRLMTPRLMTPRLLPLLLTTTLCVALTSCAHTTPAAPLAAQPQLLLLGEVHDNAAGHAARVALLKEALAKGWRPAIAMAVSYTHLDVYKRQPARWCGYR